MWCGVDTRMDRDDGIDEMVYTCMGWMKGVEEMERWLKRYGGVGWSQREMHLNWLKRDLFCVGKRKEQRSKRNKMCGDNGCDNE